MRGDGGRNRTERLAARLERFGAARDVAGSPAERGASSCTAKENSSSLRQIGSCTDGNSSPWRVSTLGAGANRGVVRAPLRRRIERRRAANDFRSERTEEQWRQRADGGRRITCCASTRPSAPAAAPSTTRSAKGTFRLRRVRPGALRLRYQVRERHRLAELLGAARQCRGHHGRSQLFHGAHRGALRAAAAAISGTSLTMVRGRPDCATA